MCVYVDIINVLMFQKELLNRKIVEPSLQPDFKKKTLHPLIFVWVIGASNCYVHSLVKRGKKENRGFLICISLVGCPPACLLKLVNGDARSFPTNTWKANWDILCKLDRYAGCTTTFQTPSTLKFTKIQSIFSISDISVVDLVEAASNMMKIFNWQVSCGGIILRSFK